MNTAVDNIIRDLTHRDGLGYEWFQLEEGTRSEIKEYWQTLINNEIKGGKIAAALDVAVALITEHLKCNLSDLCRVNAEKYLEILKRANITVHPLKTTNRSET